MPDPDRFLNFQSPGAQEWWYFDAISHDGRDSIVLVWYAGLPFDPAYGVASIRHLRDPDRHPAPNPLDHCAIGFSWYRDGRTVAYALNAFRSNQFHYTENPITLDIAGNTISRRADGSYHLAVDTLAVDRRSRIQANLAFQPAPRTTPIERDLGHDHSPHLWILAAPDCQVEGQIHCTRGSRATLEFAGRGYHDHNAGAEEISLAMKRWHWGRVHLGDGASHVYYHAETRQGHAQSLWITLADGACTHMRETPEVIEAPGKLNAFGVRSHHTLSFRDPTPTESGDTLLTRVNRHCVDDGPFYRRWLSSFVLGCDSSTPGDDIQPALGIAELLDTRNLNSPLFDWMIPFRLRRPRTPVNPSKSPHPRKHRNPY